MALATGPAPWGQCDSCSKRPWHQEEKHSFAPLFRLSSSLDRRLLSPYAFFGRSYPHSSPSLNSLHIGRRPRRRAHLSPSTKSPQTLCHVRTFVPSCPFSCLRLRYCAVVSCRPSPLVCLNLQPLLILPYVAPARTTRNEPRRVADRRYSRVHKAQGTRLAEC